jgi:hypothetical protein
MWMGLHAVFAETMYQLSGVFQLVSTDPETVSALQALYALRQCLLRYSGIFHDVSRDKFGKKAKEFLNTLRF